MRNDNFVQYILRGLKVIASVILCAAGVNFLLAAGWGLDPLTSFENGLAQVLHLSLGQAVLLFEGSTFVLFWFLDRKLLNFGSFAFCFGIGPFIDLWSWPLSLIFIKQSLFLRILYLITGSGLIIFGIAYYLPLNFGLQSLDMYSVSIANLLGKTYGTGLMITYLILLLAAFLLGIQPGITTILAMITYGFLIDKVRVTFGWI